MSRIFDSGRRRAEMVPAGSNRLGAQSVGGGSCLIAAKQETAAGQGGHSYVIPFGARLGYLADLWSHR